MTDKATYKPCSCGSDCYAIDRDPATEPCWGQVDAVDEEEGGEDGWYWVHACQGHADAYMGIGDGKYRAPPTPES